MGEGGGPVAAGDAIHEVSGAPVGPHRVEQMFVERDQIAAPLQRRRDPLDALAPGGDRSHPVRGPQCIYFQILIGQISGDPRAVVYKEHIEGPWVCGGGDRRA